MPPRCTLRVTGHLTVPGWIVRDLEGNSWFEIHLLPCRSSLFTRRQEEGHPDFEPGLWEPSGEHQQTHASATPEPNDEASSSRANSCHPEPSPLANMLIRGLHTLSPVESVQVYDVLQNQPKPRPAVATVTGTLTYYHFPEDIRHHRSQWTTPKKLPWPSI